MGNENRFVDVDSLAVLLKQHDEINKKINEINPNHCRKCGDTQPEHGFYPLHSMAFGENIYQSSGLICNKCARTKEEYERIFLKKQINM